MKNARGYILLEVAIGGAMVALLCATLLTSLADARTRNVVAGRNVIASQLALEKIEQQRALGFANLGTDSPASCSAGGVVDTPSFTLGAYTRSCTIGATTSTAFSENGGIAVSCKPVSVTVSYNTSAGKQSVTAKSAVCK